MSFLKSIFDIDSVLSPFFELGISLIEERMDGF